LTRKAKVTAIALCAVAAVVPSVLLLGSRISTSASERRVAREAERALIDDLKHVRYEVSCSRNYSRGLDALIRCSNDYDRAATANPRIRRLLSAARDSIASVVVSWGSFELWHGGTDMPYGWRGDTTTELGKAFYKAAIEMARTRADSVSRRPGEDSVRLKRLFYLAMDEGMSIIGANLGFLTREVAIYGYLPSEAELTRYGNEIQLGKIRTLLLMYRILYGQADLEYFLVEHKLPRDMAIPGAE
jgi:hypothetical protein